MSDETFGQMSDSVFDWDEANLRHIARHGVAAAEVEEALANSPTDASEQQHDDEIRYHQIGVTNRGRCLAIVTTWRGEKIRTVTAFPGTPADLLFYLEEKGLV